MRTAVSLFIWVLVMSGSVVGVSVVLAESAKRGDVKSETQVKPEDQSEIEKNGRESRRVPCDQVISHIDNDLKPGQTTDAARIAIEMHTSVIWVERCMQSYGRRINEEGLHRADVREKLLESLEEDEPEEVGSEELGELGVKDRIKRRQLQPHQEHEKRLHAPERTPKPDPQFE